MDQLSQEIINNIISFIPHHISKPDVPTWDLPPALPSLAAVSRSFQRAVERRTFQSLLIQTSDAELTEFEKIFSISHRRLNLRTLFVNFLPAEGEGWDQYATDQDREADRESSTAILRRLWIVLGNWDENTPNNEIIPTIHLNLDISSFSRPSESRGDEDNHQPFVFSPVDLTDDAESFPAVPCIRRFDIVGDGPNWSPRVPAILTSKMPKVEQVRWDLGQDGDGWGRYYSMDKQYRSDLVKGIQATRLPSSVKDFTCYLKQPSHRTPGQALPKFVEDDAHDPVSCAIREFTRDCTNVTLKGPFHPSLFDPPKSGSGSEEQPCWQQMTTLHVEMALCSPDGSWLFRPERPIADVDLPEGLIDCTRLPPGYGDTEEELEEAEEFYQDHKDIIRPPTQYEYSAVALIPNDEKLNALLTAFARGCARMPALKVANLRIDFENEDNWPFQVICVGALHRLGYWDADIANGSGCCRVYLHVNEWRPTDATIEELKNIGVEMNDQPSTICFLPWGDFYD
ncbi:hypothetical protein GGR51DRAFT_514001 [Nemania sp. FL0031]|nr:hypothetical protein GGR51DRAFT_514001 [Nemania sp. FL0031]